MPIEEFDRRVSEIGAIEQFKNGDDSAMGKVSQELQDFLANRN